MAENSYLSMFSDPSSDMFGSSLAPNDDGFMLLQPSVVTPVSASTYQSAESESTTIMTLGESSPSQPRSHSGMPSSNNTGSTFTQLGVGAGAHGGPYGFHPQFATQSSAHSTHRYPSNAYYNPGSLPSTGYSPQQQSQAQRFGQDPYRQPQYPGYGGMMANQGQAPSQGSSSNLPSASWSQPPSHSYMGQVPSMRHYPPPGGYTAPDSAQQQYLQSSFPSMGQGMQASRPMMQGYPPHLSVQQQPYPNTGQYGYPSQQPPGLPQNRIPGMPYTMPQQSMGASRFPQQSPPQMQQSQSQRPPNMFPSVPRPQSEQFSPTSQKSPEQKMQPAEQPTSSPRSVSSNAPLPMSPSPLASLSQLGPPDVATHKSPESPISRPPGHGPASSPLPPMFQHHPPQPPQQPRMPQPGQYQTSPLNQPGMMGPPSLQRMPGPPSFAQGPPMQPPTSSNGVYNGPSTQPMYQNGPNMMHQRPPQFTGSGQPPTVASLGNEIAVLKSHLQTYINSNQRSPDVDKKIIEFQSRIAHLQNQQQQQQAQQQQQGQPGMRMHYPPSQQNSNGIPPPGMMNHQSPMPGSSMGAQVKRGVDPSSIPRPNMNIHITGPPHNGYPFNAQNGQGLDSVSHSPKPSQDSAPDLAISSQDTDDEGNKYATPKKKRIRNRSAASRKRKPPPSIESMEGVEVGENSNKSSSKSSRSRNRASQKKATPTKSNFQFGKKKKKQQGSDDDGDDLDATPPPSPPVVEPDFDGNYVEKRRSGRVTKRTKYIDDVDLDEDDAADMIPANYPPTTAVTGDDNSLPEGSNSATALENIEPQTKSFFVQPGDAEPILVEKIMAHRMSKRPLIKDIPEAANGEKPRTPEPDAKPQEREVEEFYVKFKSYSYLHCDWRTIEDMELYDKRIKQKVARYKLKKESSSFMEEMDDEPFDPNYTIVERVIDEKDFDWQEVGDPQAKPKRYYLCKWMGLNYDECCWELEEDSDAIKIQEARQRQIPPPPHLRRRFPRPIARDWVKMDKAHSYKDGNTLRDYQLEGVNWLLFCWYNHQNCILADEMGLGKTVQSTVFLEHIRRFGIRGPFLVVVPLSTLGNWSREVETWTDMNGIVYHGGSIAREVIREYEFYYRNERGQRLAGIYKFDIFITTYEILLSDIFELKEIEWRAIVIDEAHRLKNKNCKLLEGLKLLDVEHRVLLTGTPLQNNVEELFSLLNFLEPERFSNAEAFSADFGDLKTDDQVTKLQNILKPMMLRRLKEDVEKSIAPKEETIIEVELTNMQKKWYRAILEKNFTFLQKGTNTANVPNLMNTMMELRKCCNHPYLLNGAEESIIDDIASQLNMRSSDPELLTKALVQASGKLVLIDKLLPKLKDGGHKVLIFSQMVRCLDILEDYLVQKRYLFERIDGRIRGPDRQAAIDRFSREDSDRFVFLLCTRAGGLGINLTAADTVIIFDSDWNPQNDLQAQARCHRIGQDKAVKVYRLITRNSYEREMFDKASLKLGLDKAVLQSSQLGAGRDAYAAAQQQLSKSDIEDLLKRGAYGALMDDDAAADQFCTEDIDQILQRRTQTVQLEAGEKGSTFSKASFAATGTRDDIDINDPDFWQKWAKKAEVNTDKDAFENELIIHEPRRRAQVRRYGEEHEEEVPVEADSDDTYDSDDEDGKGRKGRRGRKPGKKPEMEAVRLGTWQRMECLKLEKQLLIWGWGRWAEILKHSKFKRPYTEKDVEVFARTLVHYCCKQYSGSDEKAKPYVWSLVLGAFNEDWKARKANLDKLVGNVTATEDDEEASGSRSRKAKRATRKTDSEEAGTGDLGGDVPDWDKDSRYDPEKLLDVQFLKHMKKHSVNRLILRLKLLQNLKEEAILDLGEIIMNDTVYTDIPVELPPSETNDRLTDWWDDDSDKCLLIGVYKHGYEAYSAMRNDDKLCFLSKCGPSANAASADDEKEVASDAEPEPEEVPEAESTDAESETPKRGRKRTKKDTSAQPKTKSGRGRKPASAKRQMTSSGQIVFPSDADLNTRFRRLMVAYEKKRLRAEQLEQKKALRLDRQMQQEKERELRKQEVQQKKWSRREEAEFLRVATIFGVECGEDKDTFEWERFREAAKLDRKLDKTLSEYYRSFYQMLRKVCGKKLTRDEEELASLVEDIPEDKANRCIQRIELLNKVRLVVLPHPKLEERLKLCQPFAELPNWWIIGQHDKELLEGAAKHGLNDTACNIAVDPDYSFADCIKSALTSENKKSSNIHSKMESILKRETKAEKPPTPKTEEKSEDTDDESERKLKIESDEEDKKETEVDKKEEEVEENGVAKEEKIETQPQSEKSEEKEEEHKSVSEEKITKKSEDEEKAKDSATTSTSSFNELEERESSGELTVAQLLAKGMYAKGWPSDRVIQARLEHVCYCIEHNRWPSKRTQALMYGSIPDDQAAIQSVQQQPSQQPTGFPENFLDSDFALLAAAAGHIPGLNGVEPRRRRGRRPKAEVEAERIAQFHAAQAALLAQQQALLQAATSKNRRSHAGQDMSSGRSQNRDSTAMRPPPAHQKAERNDTDNEVEGVLDLTGKSKPSTSQSNFTSASRKESQQQPEKGSKLSQKVDTLLKKRKQETQIDLMDPNCRIPVMNIIDGCILRGDKAPKQKDIQTWLMEHPNYVVDTTAFALPGMFPDMSLLNNGSSSSSKRSGQESPSSDQNLLSGEEHVTVIHRKTGKKISGRKAPQLKNLAEWLEGNADYDIDPTWTELLREQGAIAAKTDTPSSSKRGRKSNSDALAATANLFGGSPFGAGFGMGPGGLLPGFPRLPFPFPGMPGFPGLPNALMGMLPGMGGDSESTKSESASSSKKDRESSGKDTSRKSKSEKQAKAEQAQQQANMESMMQSQLPFIFPQANMFGGMHPFLTQGFPGMSAGFPFGISSLMNGFGKDMEAAASPSEKSSKSDKDKEKRRRASSPSEKSEPSSSSSRRKTPAERPAKVREEIAASDADED